MIVNEMLKYGNAIFCSPLTKLFNTILSTGCYPTAWSTGIIVPILKSGDPMDPNNYRGITLSSCIGKKILKILCND